MRERLHFVVLLNLIVRVVRFVEGQDDLSDGDADFGAGLISSLRNDANLDLSVDEEYEDLRAELLAYHTALASLTAQKSRSEFIALIWLFERLMAKLQNFLRTSRYERVLQKLC